MLEARNSSQPPPLRGVFSPVLTPFNQDLAPDAPRFLNHCKWLLSQGVGLAMFGTNSEGNSLSVVEKCFLLDALLADGVPMDRAMPGTGSCSLSDAVAMTNACVQAGCGGVLVVPPFYYKNPGDDGLYRFYAELIERVGDKRLRVYLYHIPQVAGVGISAGLVERLLDAYPGTVAGMKDTGGNWAYTRDMISRYGLRGFDTFAGSEEILVDTIRAGGAGCITATANVNPSAIVDLYQRVDKPEAEVSQARVSATRSIFSAYPLIAAMKSALAHFRGDPEWRTLRPPLMKLGAAESAQLLARLSSAGFSMPSH